MQRFSTFAKSIIMKYIILTISLAAIQLFSVTAKEKAALPYQDVSLTVEERVADLMSRMTIEEKIGQLNQRNGYIDAEELRADIRRGNIGAFVNGRSGEADEMQRVAVEESRLGIPLLIGRDVIHGFRTIFPIPLGQAATFDTDVAKEGARIAAREASAEGVNWTFAPMIDISRDARWGRIAESCGEDTYLASEMARAMVRGFQGDTLSDPTSIGACAKHFVGYGASEAGRDYNTTNIPERQMRQTYLPPFRTAVDEGVVSLMTAFNENDGIPMSANRHLLTEILRDEWGFDGFTVSDYNAIQELISHGLAADRRHAAALALSAGTDMDMDTRIYIENAKDLLESGEISMEMIDRGVAGILRTKFRLGLFENPYIRTSHDVIYAPEHLEAARKAARKSVVMLKNDNSTLPLTDGCRTVLLTGPLSDAKYEQLGTWIFDGEKEHTVTLREGLQQECDRRGIRLIFETAMTYTRDTTKLSLERAIKAAGEADVIIAAVGEESILSGEAHCLSDLNLVGGQRALIEQLAATRKPLVLIVMAGRPLTIEHEAEMSDAVLYSFHPGTMGGPALADLIFGIESPSGKTPVTFPRSVGQIPIFYNHNSTGRPLRGDELYIEDIPPKAENTFLGCTSYWLDIEPTPLYPFGYGLSYGDFSYSDITVDKSSFGPDDTIVASAMLTNNGQYAAEEVVQLYVRDQTASVVRPVKELKRFSRVALQPGESRRVEFRLPVAELSFVGIDFKECLELGKFTLWIGGNSDCRLSTEFSVTK